MTENVETLDAALRGQAQADLFKKIAQVMGEVGRIPKAGYNDFHKYAYVTEADLVEAVREKLATRNVALIPSVTRIERDGQLTTYTGTFTFVCGDTGATFASGWAGQGEDKGDKGLYKAYTGALKYFLMKTFLIATGDDPEADTSTDQRAAARKPAGKRAPMQAGKPASDKQKKLLADLRDRKKPTAGWIRLQLIDLGVTDVPADADGLRAAVEGLDGKTLSGLIERLMEMEAQAG